MSTELGLLQKIIKDKYNPKIFKEHNITEKLFKDEGKKVFSFILNYYKEYNSPPPIQTVELETGIKFPKLPDNTLEYWADGLKQLYKRKLVLMLAKRIIDNKGTEDFKKNCGGWIREIHNELNAFEIVEKVYKLIDKIPEVINEHDRRQKSSSMFGIPFGIPYLDKISDGAQPGDIIVICARPEIGKTMLLLQMALTAQHDNKIPLYVTLEMSAFQDARRLLAMEANVPSVSLRLGKLSHWAKNKLDDAEKRFIDRSKKTPFYLLEGSLRTTVEDIISIVQDIKPDILYVDGAYILHTTSKITNRVERVAYTTEVLKGIATNFNIPVIATYQYNRAVKSTSTGSLANIGWSDVVSQLASIALGLADSKYNDERLTFQLRQNKILELKKGREGEKGKIKLLYDMQKMKITQEEVISGVNVNF